MTQSDGAIAPFIRRTYQQKTLCLVVCEVGEAHRAAWFLGNLSSQRLLGIYSGEDAYLYHYFISTWLAIKRLRSKEVFWRGVEGWREAIDVGESL